MIYWLIFLIWILYAYFSKKESLHHLWIALSLFILAAILQIISFDNLAEPIMRVSLLGWVIGLFMSYVEYQKKSKLD